MAKKVRIAGVDMGVMDLEELEQVAREEGLTLVVMRVEDGPPAVPKSTTVVCSTCGRTCWISPGTKAGTPASAVIRCVQCMSSDLLEGEQPCPTS